MHTKISRLLKFGLAIAGLSLPCGETVDAAVASPPQFHAEIQQNDFRITHVGIDGAATYGGNFPSAAYNATQHEYLVVYIDTTNKASQPAPEPEVYGHRIDAVTGANVGGAFRISDMGNADGDGAYNANIPTVAWNATNNEYLVAWEGYDNAAPLALGEREIYGQRLNGVTGAEIGANDFRISDVGPDGNSAYNAEFAQIAWNATNNEYLVVWSADEDFISDGIFEVFGQRIQGGTGAELGTNDFRISQHFAGQFNTVGGRYPGVAWNATGNEYMVVWTGGKGTGPSTLGDSEVYSQRLSGSTCAEVGTGDLRISHVGTDGDTAREAQFARVAWNSQDNEFLVAYTADEPSAGLADNQYQVFGQRLTGATGAPTGAAGFRISKLLPAGVVADRVSDVRIVWNALAGEYLVAWAAPDWTGGATSSPAAAEIFAQGISPVGATLENAEFRATDVGPDGNTSYDANWPGLASNSTRGEFLVVWFGNDNVAPLAAAELEVFGQLIAPKENAAGLWRRYE